MVGRACYVRMYTLCTHACTKSVDVKIMYAQNPHATFGPFILGQNKRRSNRIISVKQIALKYGTMLPKEGS